MRGAPIADAMEAARAFARAEPEPAARRGHVQRQASSSRSRSPPTRRRSTTRSRERRRSPRGRTSTTRVAEAVQLIRGANAQAGRIVLLSDGADVGQPATTDDASDRRARTRDVRVFTVGLRSTAFDPAALADHRRRRPAERTRRPTPRADLDAASSTSSARSSRTSTSCATARSSGPTRTGQRRGRASPAIRRRDDVVHDARRSAPIAPYEQSSWRQDRRGRWLSSVLVVVLGRGRALRRAIAPVRRARRAAAFARASALFVSIAATSQSRQRDRGSSSARARRAPSGRSRRRDWWAGSRRSASSRSIDDPAERIVLVGSIAARRCPRVSSWSSSLGSPWSRSSRCSLPLIVRGASSQRKRRGASRKAFAEQLAGQPPGARVRAARRAQPRRRARPWSSTTRPSRRRSEFRRVVADEQLGVPLDEALDVVVRADGQPRPRAGRARRAAPARDRQATRPRCSTGWSRRPRARRAAPPGPRRSPRRGGWRAGSSRCCPSSCCSCYLLHQPDLHASRSSTTPVGIAALVVADDHGHRRLARHQARSSTSRSEMLMILILILGLVLLAARRDARSSAALALPRRAPARRSSRSAPTASAADPVAATSEEAPATVALGRPRGLGRRVAQPRLGVARGAGAAQAPDRGRALHDRRRGRSSATALLARSACRCLWLWLAQLAATRARVRDRRRGRRRSRSSAGSCRSRSSTRRARKRLERDRLRAARADRPARRHGRGGLGFTGLAADGRRAAARAARRGAAAHAPGAEHGPLDRRRRSQNMLERADTPGMRSFVRSIVQGETLGVSIGQIMRNLADRDAQAPQGGGRGAGAEGADQDALPARSS